MSQDHNDTARVRARISALRRWADTSQQQRRDHMKPANEARWAHKSPAVEIDRAESERLRRLDMLREARELELELALAELRASENGGAS